MRFRLGKGRDSMRPGSEFVPTAEEVEQVRPFIENRDVSYLDAKARIMGNESILEARREQLADWMRDERARDPLVGKERIGF